MAELPRPEVLDIDSPEAWPEVPYQAWKDTYATLHRYTQIIGKVRLALAPPLNHWWHTALYLTAHGLTTSPIPYGELSFEVEFDFVHHELHFRTSRPQLKVMALEPRPVAEFYRDVMATLRSLGIAVRIWDVPVEIPDDTTRFSEDTHHRSYDPEYAWRCWRALLTAHTVLSEFRGRFTGKCSPVHFFWGSFDLAVTRFSGRCAPERPGADSITREAYSEECISHGFWPGTEALKGPAFYAYAAPEPAGCSTARIRPEGAGYDSGLKEFLLPYDVVRSSQSPRETLLEFLQSTYEVGARLAGWNREALERPLITRPVRPEAPAPEAGPAGLPEQPPAG